RPRAAGGRCLRSRPEPRARSPPGRDLMGWATDVHPTQAELAACAQCGLCLPHCPTYRLTGLDTASPRGRLMAMSAVADGELEVDGSFRDIMTFWLECRASEA